MQGRCTPVCTSDSDCGHGQRCTSGRCIDRRCGDGQVDPGETCDNGDLNKSPGNMGASCACAEDDPRCKKSFEVSWSMSCVWAKCGDGVVNNLAVFQGRTVNYDLVHEQCDDGPANGLPGNPCSKTCQIVLAQAAPVTFCGNGKVELGEQCDDGLLNGKTVSICTTECSIVRTTGAGNDFDPPTLNPGDSASIDLPLLPGQFIDPRTGTVQTSLTHIATSNPPAGQTGPAALGVMAFGAAAGWAWMRRKKFLNS